VTLIALASIKGSPGVTTAALAMAASWPTGRQVLLVEADPFGGDLAPRYGTAATGGLASLFAAARRSLRPEDVWDHVDRLPGGLPVLFGLTGMHQAVANEKAWPVVVGALGDQDGDVVVDVGRLLPNLGGGVREVLARADALVVLCESTLEAIVHLREALPALVAELRNRRLFVVPTGSVQFSAADIERTLQVEVLPSLPDDPEAAAALANRRAIKRLEKTRLLKWANETIAALGIEAISDAEPDSVAGIEDPSDANSFGDGSIQPLLDIEEHSTSGVDDGREPSDIPDGVVGDAAMAGVVSGPTWEVGR
jgi:MinD-like ATPase involved in chromosome partitioning or flagellar assembly